ncbi:MAG TPA: lysophospholipid acyltransferase family protein [Longimicrobiales bacterium]
MKSGARYWLAGFAGRYVLDALLATVRVRVVSARTHMPFVAHGKPVIYTLWHGRLLPLTHLHRNQDVATMISRSADGEYIARLVERWGYTCARGSSSRGGSAALRELVKAARAGHSLAITPDGPRGPRQEFKRGALTAAQLSGAPLIPISASASSAWWIEGWDRFLVPKPFSTLFVRYGDPIFVPRDASEAQLCAIEAKAEQILNQLTEDVDTDARGS